MVSNVIRRHASKIIISICLLRFRLCSFPLKRVVVRFLHVMIHLAVLYRCITSIMT